jgi:hypothetical protein
MLFLSCTRICCPYLHGNGSACAERTTDGALARLNTLVGGNCYCHSLAKGIGGSRGVGSLALYRLDELVCEGLLQCQSTSV